MLVFQLLNYDILRLFSGKMDGATTQALEILELKTCPKSWPTGWTFGVNSYLQIVPEIFKPQSPFL